MRLLLNINDEINTIHTANGQTPFVTFGFGLGTSWEARLLQKSIFEVRLKGLGKHHRTAIFPKLTFCIKEGLNRKKGDPNYDIKRLALKCMSKRIYPDILNYDEVVRVTGGFKAPMGCVDGEEVITYRLDNVVVHCTNFEDLWDKVQPLGIETYNSSEYIKTDNLEILDIDGEFTKVHGVIKNKDKGDWRRVQFTNGRTLVCTGDHPLPVEGKGRVFVDDMEIGDVVKRTPTFFDKLDKLDFNGNCECKVVSITDLGYRGKPSYDVTTESDTFVVSGLHSHNCRSFLHEYVDPESGEKVYDGRNNMGVISLNLPAIAMQTNDPDKFMQLLDERMELAHKGLEARIDRMRGVTADTAPILYMEGAFGKRLKAKDDVIQLFENGRASVSIGYIGIHEMCEVLFPTEPHIYESDRKKAFAVEVVKRMHDRCNQWKSESGWAYSLYSTPSESLCDRFCRIDSERFDNEKYGYLFEKGYYTNSFHLDVSKKTSPDGKIDFESDFPQYATGGNIVYCELPDMSNFIDALEWVVDYSYDKVPYFGTNMPINYCGACGHAGEVEATEKGFACPECGNHDPETLQVVIRVCGYLGNPESRPFIEGKQKEVMRRITHTGD